MKYLLGLGSNTGDSLRNLEEAAQRLSRLEVRIGRKSPVYRTEPVGRKNQPWFLNQALEIETVLSPAALLRIAKQIERKMGRRPGPPNGPRPIDIDILLAGDLVLATARLEIPHPRLAGRRFALVPLAQIAPAAVHPVLNKSIRAILRDCPDRSKVIRLSRASSARPNRRSPTDKPD